MSTEPKREAVAFPPNVPQAIALEQTAPFESAYGKWGYWLTGHRIMFVPRVCSVLIGNLDPQPGEEFYVTRKETRQGKHHTTEWLVSNDAAMHAHEPGPNGKPGDTLAAAAVTGIEETKLERQVRESREVKEAAANRLRAKLNLEQKIDEAAATHGATPSSIIMTPPREERRQTVLITQQDSKPAWTVILANQTQGLIDAYADGVQYAQKHGGLVKPEDVRALLTTAFISLSQNRQKGRAA